MTETLDTLRDELFKALRGLGNKDEPLDIDRAKAIAEIGQVIINTAKAENDHLRITGGKGSGFIPDSQVVRLPGLAKVETTETATAMVSVTHLPGATITRHKMRD